MAWFWSVLVGLAGLMGCSPTADGSSQPATSSVAECAIIQVMLANELARIAEVSPDDSFVIDPNGQSPWMREAVDGSRIPPLDVIEGYFPELRRPDAEPLSAFYDHPRDPWRLTCDLADLSLAPASDALAGQEDDQDALTFPRMAVDRPVISPDGRFAIAGFSWSYVPYTGYSDDCLFENVDGTWREVQCAGLMDGVYS